MMARKRKLTVKQKRFVAEYLKDSNGARAAIEAGYSPKYAKQIAYELLYQTIPVKEAIQREEEAYLRAVGVYTKDVLARMAKIANVDIRKIYSPETNTLLSVKDFPDEIVPAIAGIKTTELFEGRGEDRHLVGYTKEVRLWDPNPSLTNMAKNLGVIGNGKHHDEGDDDEGEIGRVMSPIELSAKIVYLVKLAVERKKEIEAQKALGGKSQDEKPKELLK